LRKCHIFGVWPVEPAGNPRSKLYPRTFDREPAFRLMRAAAANAEGRIKKAPRRLPKSGDQ
jgi:hypothetical protein